MSYLLKIALYIRIICPSIGGFRVFEYPLFGEYCFVFLLPRRLKMTQLISKVNRWPTRKQNRAVVVRNGFWLVDVSMERW